MSVSLSTQESKPEFLRQYNCAQTAAVVMEACAPHQCALLNILAVSDRHQLDPAPLLSSLADELPTSYRKRILQLAEKKMEGVETLNAIEAIPGLFPPSVYLALRLARDNGTLPTIFDVLLNEHAGSRVDSIENDDSLLPRLARLAGITLTVTFVMGFVMVKVVPDFKAMLEEFGVQLPTSMKMLVAIWDFAVRFWLIDVVLFAMIPFFFVLLRDYVRRFSRFTWQQRRLSRPAARRLALALVCQSGRTVKSGVSLILGYRPLRRIFGRLKKAERRIDNGQAGWRALAAENIISSREETALSRSTSNETQAWLLRWSASTRHAAQTVNMGLFFRGLTSLVFLIIGLLVTLTAISVFSTLIAIMSQLQ